MTSLATINAPRFVCTKRQIVISQRPENGLRVAWEANIVMAITASRPLMVMWQSKPDVSPESSRLMRRTQYCIQPPTMLISSDENVNVGNTRSVNLLEKVEFLLRTLQFMNNCCRRSYWEKVGIYDRSVNIVQSSVLTVFEKVRHGEESPNLDKSPLHYRGNVRHYDQLAKLGNFRLIHRMSNFW